MHRCGAPCDGSESVEQYAAHSAVFTAAVAGDVRPLVAPLFDRIDRLASGERYEEAAALRDRLAVFVRACARQQRLTALTSIPELVAARPDGHGGWELSVVRHGRLVAAGVAPRGASPWPYIDALRASAETVQPQLWPLPVASAEETECILRWLEKPGTRLVAADAQWSCPVHGAGMLHDWLDIVEASRGTEEPFADRRGLHPIARPARATA
jgi:DNA polymerase-3 subunit epsilon